LGAVCVPLKYFSPLPSLRKCTQKKSSENKDRTLRGVVSKTSILSEKSGVAGLKWGLYGGLEPSRNRVVVPARQSTKAGGIDSWAP
jgi:hypothetical protein